jgi:predicted ribosome quality control (RQC) complex YloA/Tae2 family protein
MGHELLMNNYYTLLHLADSLKRNLSGSTFVSAVTGRKHLLELRFEGSGSPRLLTISVEPSATALFLSPYREAPSSNTATFFEDLAGQRLTDVSLAETDRLMRFVFASGDALLVMAYSSKANVFLVREGVVVEAFKQDSVWAGKPEPVPASAAKPTQRLPRGVPMAALGQIVERPEPAYVDGWGLSLASEEVLPGTRLKRYADVNEAVRDVFLKHLHERTFVQRKSQIQDRLHRLEAGLAHNVIQLEAHPEGLKRADSYEHFGRLLTAYAYETPAPDADTFVVDDWMRSGERIDVPIRKGLSLSASAEWYFRKAKEARTAVKQAALRLEETRRRLEEVRSGLTSLADITQSAALEKWKKAHAGILERTGFDASGEDQLKVPYRRMEASGYEIWVGKNAQSNDDLLRLAHKDDLWLHARGSAGSHVVIRMRKQTKRPPQPVIDKAAGLAAWYSKQKGSSLVPVILTHRKYVRKPKGAPPGLVVVEREDVLMVKPDQGI